jgi:hypothetical protein
MGALYKGLIVAGVLSLDRPSGFVIYWLIGFGVLGRRRRYPAA